MAFYIWQTPDDKERLIDYLIHNDNEKEGTLALLSDDVKDKITSFLNENEIIDESNEETEDYLDILNEEFERYF